MLPVCARSSGRPKRYARQVHWDTKSILKCVEGRDRPALDQVMGTFLGSVSNEKLHPRRKQPDPIRRFSENVDKGPAEVGRITSYFRNVIADTGITAGLTHHDVKPKAD